MYVTLSSTEIMDIFITHCNFAEILKFYFFKFYFIFKLYNIVLVLSNIEMKFYIHTSLLQNYNSYWLTAGSGNCVNKEAYT